MIWDFCFGMFSMSLSLFNITMDWLSRIHFCFGTQNGKVGEESFIWCFYQKCIGNISSLLPLDSSVVKAEVCLFFFFLLRLVWTEDSDMCRLIIPKEKNGLFIYPDKPDTGPLAQPVACIWGRDFLFIFRSFGLSFHLLTLEAQEQNSD